MVITADLPLAGQLAPGDWIEFAPCTRQTAVEALRRRQLSLSEGSDDRRGRAPPAGKSGRGAGAADAPLAPLTTFKVGGRAEWLVQLRTRDDIVRALEVARELGFM